MIITAEIAKKLEVLVHPEVENAIILLLDTVLKQKEDIFTNPQATDADLRQYQGQKVLISELKQYKTRLKDAFVRETEE